MSGAFFSRRLGLLRRRAEHLLDLVAADAHHLAGAGVEAVESGAARFLDGHGGHVARGLALASPDEAVGGNADGNPKGQAEGEAAELVGVKRDGHVSWRAVRRRQEDATAAAARPRSGGGSGSSSEQRLMVIRG